MSKSITDKTLALAGIYQAAALVHQIATEGRAEPGPFATAVNSLVVTDPGQTLEVYDSLEAIQWGLQRLQAQLGNAASRQDLPVTGYALNLMQLEKKLSRRPELLERIRQGLEHARRQAEHFELTHPNVIAGLADVYANTVSTLTPRIMVLGDHGHLSHAENAAKVRTLLLAGIRSAVLWRQCGGSRLQLLFRRRALVDEAARLLRQVG